ncbi:MAG: Rne/Rng family ribonuclease [Oligosphaeraceae bacterium]
MKQILINSEELQVRVAVVEDGTLQDFFMERTNKDRIVGSIYKGKIKNLEPSLQAAFVDIGVGKNAFLHYWDMLPATLEKLEGEGEEEDEPPVKPGQERAEANRASRAEEGGADNPPAPPAQEAEEEEGEVQQADGETPEGESQAAPEEAAPVAPVVQKQEQDTSLTKGLLPLEQGQKGLIPLAKPQEKPAPQERELPPLSTDENPPPLAEEIAGKPREGQPRRGGQPRAPQAADEDSPSHRRRRRRGRGGRDLVPLQGGQSAPARPAKPGVFRRLFNFFFPFLQKGGAPQPQDAVQERRDPARPASQEKEPRPARGLTANSGKNELLPLTPAGKPHPQKGAAQPAKLEKLPKPEKEKEKEKPRKAEKKGYTVEDIPNLFHVDQEILVQVTKGPIGTKGARVTTNLSIPGRYLVLLPNCPHVGISRRVEDREERSRLKQMIRTILPPNTGVICRTEGVGLKREYFQRDLQMLMDAWHKAEDTAAKRRAPVCVYQEPALVERTLRDNLTQDIDEIVCDTKEAYNLALEMLQRFDRQDSIKVKLYSNPTPIFIKYGISQQIEGISNRKVPLPSGGYLCIDETEALIAIDVNTGKNRSGKDQPETILATNMEAVKEIARQLRLRNIGGLVVLDLIDMRSRKDQMAVYRAFKQYTAEDHARIKIYPISGLGLLEMSRQRESESLESTIYEDCPYCKGRGLIKTATSVSVEIQRRLNELLARKKDVQHFVITVHPKILERLRTVDHKVMNAMAAEHNRQLTFNANPELHIEDFHIADKDTGKVF